MTLVYWGRRHTSHDRLYRRWDGFRSGFLQFMSDYDLVLSPVAPEVAPLYRTKLVGERRFSYTLPYSLTGNPCVVVRAGTSPEGLPTGVQVVARNWHDDFALRARPQHRKSAGRPAPC